MAISFTRYDCAHIDQPLVIYVDRGCCRNADMPTQLNELFSPWTTPVRLDVFHFMQRFRFCCFTEAHPLYGEFMSRLSGAIFQWDPEDIAKLIEAKRSSLGPNYRSVPDHDVS